MISSEVQRTLVKSPPELWAEISDPEALARHLGEFGEIRITRVQPEQKVEWEAPEASGSIVIKPSGWGTKVKLTVMRELSEGEAGDGADDTPQAGELPAVDHASAGDGEAATDEAAANEAAAEEALASDEAPVAEADEPQGTANDVRAAEPDAMEQPIPALATEDEADENELAGKSESQREPEPDRRRGFFARLFGRRRAAHAAEADGIDAQAVSIAPMDDLERAHEAEFQGDDYDEPAVGTSEIVDESAPSASLAPERELPIEGEAELDGERATTPAASGASDPMDAPKADRATEDGASEHPSPTETAASLVAELEQAEEAAAERVTAVLTGVLDRLGAAHHRPFSRA